MADDRPAAAISTWRAAEITGAQVVAREIADNLEQCHALHRAGPARRSAARATTRRASASASRRPIAPERSSGRSMELRQAGINMTKVESRPSKTLLGQYIFLVDINGHARRRTWRKRWNASVSAPGMLKVFGSYPRWQPYARAARQPTTSRANQGSRSATGMGRATRPLRRGGRSWSRSRRG
jgi:prephenate dehydratase